MNTAHAFAVAKMLPNALAGTPGADELSENAG
jgi:hypothetical protein